MCGKSAAWLSLLVASHWSETNRHGSRAADVIAEEIVRAVQYFVLLVQTVECARD